MTDVAPAPRPRVEGEREDEILDATLELLLEHGYDRLTMDAVAKAARASKATLYRRWETKAALVVDAVVRAKDAPDVSDHDTGTLRGDLLATYCAPHAIGDTAATRAMGSVVTALCTDAEFGERFREQVVAPKIAISRAAYERAIARGDIDADVDLDLITPALAAVLMHRAFLLGELPDDEAVRRVVDHLILPAVGHRPPTGSATSPAPSQEGRTRD